MKGRAAVPPRPRDRRSCPRSGCRVDGRLDHAERGLVVGTDRVHDRVGAFERLAQAVAIRDVDRPPRHAGLAADRGGSLARRGRGRGVRLRVPNRRAGMRSPGRGTRSRARRSSSDQSCPRVTDRSRRRRGPARRSRASGLRHQPVCRTLRTTSNEGVPGRSPGPFDEHLVRKRPDIGASGPPGQPSNRTAPNPPTPRCSQFARLRPEPTPPCNRTAPNPPTPRRSQFARVRPQPTPPCNRTAPDPPLIARSSRGYGLSPRRRVTGRHRTTPHCSQFAR